MPGPAVPTQDSILKTLITLGQLAETIVKDPSATTPADRARLSVLIETLWPVFLTGELHVGASLMLAIAVRELIYSVKINGGYHELMRTMAEGAAVLSEAERMVIRRRQQGERH